MFIRIFTILYCLTTIHFTFCMELIPKEAEKKNQSEAEKRRNRFSKRISTSHIIPRSKSGRSFSLDRGDEKKDSPSLSHSKLSFSDESKETNKNINITNENNKIDENGNTSLMRAILKNNPRLVKSLLKQEPNINYRNKWGNTAIHIATIQNNPNPKILQLLLNDNRLNASIYNSENKLPIEYLDFNKGNMTFYAQIRNKMYLNMLSHLPKYNNKSYFDIENLNENTINTIDGDGTSILIWATCTDQSKIIKHLLQYENLNINHQDKLLGTALHSAALFGRSTILHMLLLDYRTNGNIHNCFNQKPHRCTIKNFSNKKKIYSDLMSKITFKDNSDETSSSLEEKESLENTIALFARAKINQTIQQETCKILLENIKNNTSKYFLTNKIISDNILYDIIQAIHNYIKSEKEHQDSELPEHVDIPQYATNDFLKKMIQFNFIENLKDILLTIKKELSQKEKHNNISFDNAHLNNNTINTLDNEKNSILIWSVFTNQSEDFIKNILNYDNLIINHQDKILYTALHWTALLGKEKIIKLFLLDPRTDASIKNIFGQQPHDCLTIETLNYDQKKLKEIDEELSIRAKLNEFIHEEIFDIISKQGVEKSTSEEVLLNNETLSKIIENIKEIYQKKQIQLPAYINNDFLEKMIQYTFIKNYLANKLTSKI